MGKQSGHGRREKREGEGLDRQHVKDEVAGGGHAQWSCWSCGAAKKTEGDENKWMHAREFEAAGSTCSGTRAPWEEHERNSGWLGSPAATVPWREEQTGEARSRSGQQGSLGGSDRRSSGSGAGWMPAGAGRRKVARLIGDGSQGEFGWSGGGGGGWMGQGP
nr:uncharacterized protein LOC109761358 [Aegilops tauschii subsp. strangulata]